MKCADGYAEVTAFLCLLNKAFCPTMFHVDNKGIIEHWPMSEGRGLVDLVWEELHRVHQEHKLVEVEHVKAHRTEKERQRVSLLEKFITEGNEKADELAKQGARLD